MLLSLEGGCLARPVDAEQAEALGLAHAKGQPIHRHSARLPAVLLHQVPHLHSVGLVVTKQGLFMHTKLKIHKWDF